MVTLKDIASRCGLSIATVSKALNGMPDISAATVKRVQAAANEMGYLPNAAARSMKTGRSMIIGLLWFFRNGTLWENEYFTGVASGIQRVMDSRGYDITPVNCNGASLMGSWLNYCRYRNYDGLIVMSGSVASSSLQDLINSKFPLVTIDNIFSGRSSVMTDAASSIATLVHYAYRMGHRRIAYISGEPCYTTETRRNGFVDACRELGITMPDAYFREAQYHNADACTLQAESLLRLPEPPTCIFCPDDYAAVGVINRFAEKGISVPRDISVIGYDGTRLGNTISPRLTTLRQDSNAIGSTAANLLLEYIDSVQPPEPKRFTLPGLLIEGGSVLDMNAR